MVMGIPTRRAHYSCREFLLLHAVINGGPLHNPSNSCDNNALRNDSSQDISDKASLVCRISISGWEPSVITSDNASAGAYIHREGSPRSSGPPLPCDRQARSICILSRDYFLKIGVRSRSDWSGDISRILILGLRC
jgi:hypothetical protein